MKGTGEGTYREHNARRAFREPHFELARRKRAGVIAVAELDSVD